MNVYFHICVKMRLSKILGGIGDKVIHLISLIRLFSDLVSVSSRLCSGENRRCCVSSSCLLTSMSVSGEDGVLDEEVLQWKVGRGGNKKMEREREREGCLGEHIFESGGDD